MTEQELQHGHETVFSLDSLFEPPVNGEEALVLESSHSNGYSVILPVKRFCFSTASPMPQAQPAALYA